MRSHNLCNGQRYNQVNFKLKRSDAWCRDRTWWKPQQIRIQPEAASLRMPGWHVELPAADIFRTALKGPSSLSYFFIMHSPKVRPIILKTKYFFSFQKSPGTLKLLTIFGEMPRANSERVSDTRVILYEKIMARVTQASIGVCVCVWSTPRSFKNRQGNNEK